MNQFEIVQQVIEGRRNCKPAQFNDSKITEEDIKKIVAAANWAPTHGRTEPWRFIVLPKAAGIRFSKEHAELYKENTATEAFQESKYEGLRKMGEKSSYIIIVYNHSGANPKIPETEEICATACAIQNMLLTAQSLGIASFWSTGGQISKPSMHQYLKLGAKDTILGVIFFGYSDTDLAAKRNTHIDEKIQWKSR